MEDDPLAPAKGIVNGIALSIPFWCLIAWIIWG